MPKPNENQQQPGIPVEQALNMAWAKVGQLGFQIDMLTQMNAALENENKKLKSELEALKGRKKGK